MGKRDKSPDQLYMPKGSSSGGSSQPQIQYGTANPYQAPAQGKFIPVVPRSRLGMPSAPYTAMQLSNDPPSHLVPFGYAPPGKGGQQNPMAQMNGQMNPMMSQMMNQMMMSQMMGGQMMNPMMGGQMMNPMMGGQMPNQMPNQRQQSRSGARQAPQMMGPSTQGYEGGPPPQFQQRPPQGYQGGPPPQFQQRPPQGGPPQGYQGGPPPQFQQGPPQGYQGGPPPQFQQGPPQGYQGGPPPQFQQGQPAPKSNASSFFSNSNVRSSFS